MCPSGRATQRVARFLRDESIGARVRGHRGAQASSQRVARPETLVSQGFRAGRGVQWCRSVNPKVEGSSPSPGASGQPETIMARVSGFMTLSADRAIRPDSYLFSTRTGTGPAQDRSQRFRDAGLGASDSMSDGSRLRSPGSFLSRLMSRESPRDAVWVNAPGFGEASSEPGRFTRPAYPKPLTEEVAAIVRFQACRSPFSTPPWRGTGLARHPATWSPVGRPRG